MIASELANRIGAKSSGNGYSLICPCHDDTNPSLQFFDSQYNGKPYIYFKCYTGCSHENIKEYYQSIGHLPKPKEYVKREYTNQYAIKETPQNIKKVEQKDFTPLYQDFLSMLGNDDAIEYMESRGISAHYAEKYQIKNLRHDGKNEYYIQEELTNKYGIGYLIESRLYSFNYLHDPIKPLSSHLYFPLVNHRLIIPYMFNGKIFSLLGRLINPPSNENTPKNMNLKGKSIPLYNKDALQDARESNQKVCICEGVFDVLSIYELGLVEKYGHPIGIAGVNNYKDLINLVEGVTVTIATDNDKAGQGFSERFSKQYYEKYKIPTRRITFGESKDVNDYLIYKTKNT